MKEKSFTYYLEKHILTCLDEIEGQSDSEFVLGEAYAYIECLEIIRENRGVENETMLALESKYGIK